MYTHFLCVSPNIMAKASGFFPIFLFFGSFSVCLSCHSACSALVPPPPQCPLRDICRGRLCGPRVGWLLWWQVAAGHRAKHVVSKEERKRKRHRAGRAENILKWRQNQRWPMAWPHHCLHSSQHATPTLRLPFSSLSKHVTGSVFNIPSQQSRASKLCGRKSWKGK